MPGKPKRLRLRGYYWNNRPPYYMYNFERRFYSRLASNISSHRRGKESAKRSVVSTISVISEQTIGIKGDKLRTISGKRYYSQATDRQASRPYTLNKPPPYVHRITA